MKASYLSLCLLCIVFLISVSCENGNENIAGKQTGKYELNFTPAKTNAELRALRADPNANLIRTEDEFNKLITQSLTPLSNLPAHELDDFKRGIVFREGVGVVGLNIGIIKKTLKIDEYNEAMALFGLDTKNGFWGAGNASGRADLGEDYKGYKCLTPGTCFKAVDWICLNGC